MPVGRWKAYHGRWKLLPVIPSTYILYHLYLRAPCTPCKVCIPLPPPLQAPPPHVPPEPPVPPPSCTSPTSCTPCWRVQWYSCLGLRAAHCFGAFWGEGEAKPGKLYNQSWVVSLSVISQWLGHYSAEPPPLYPQVLETPPHPYTPYGIKYVHQHMGWYISNWRQRGKLCRRLLSNLKSKTNLQKMFIFYF